MWGTATGLHVDNEGFKARIKNKVSQYMQSYYIGPYMQFIG